MVVPSFAPPSSILWGQNTLFLLTKEKGSQHTPTSLPEQDPEDPLSHCELWNHTLVTNTQCKAQGTQHLDLPPAAEGGFGLSGRAKAAAEGGEEEEPEGGSQPPPCSFDPRAMLAAGQSLLWAVLICAGHECLPGGSVAAGDYQGQGHPPFSLPHSRGQGKGWGETATASLHGCTQGKVSSV